MTLRHCVCCG